MARRVSLDDWERAVEVLREFGDRGEVTVGDDRVRIDFGSARVTVARDGTVETGMPLHEFAADGDVDLVVDGDAGELIVAGEDVRYTFRRPGG